MRLLHVESDELILHGFQRAVPPDWDVTSMPIPQGVLRLPADGSWDVCVLGVGGGDGAIRDVLSCLAQLTRARFPLLAWITASAEDYVPAMKAFGVMGFVSRLATFDELSSAIRSVVSGDPFIDYRFRHGGAGGLTGLGLTRTQERVAALYAVYGSRRLVAQDLLVTENTVKYHLQLIYKKTRTSNLHGLHQLLRSRGWAPPEPGRHRGK